jgi:hypothetical protein
MVVIWMKMQETWWSPWWSWVVLMVRDTKRGNVFTASHNYSLTNISFLRIPIALLFLVFTQNIEK